MERARGQDAVGHTGLGAGPGERHRAGDLREHRRPDHLRRGPGAVRGTPRRRPQDLPRLVVTDRDRLPSRRVPRHRRVHRQPVPRRRRRPLYRRGAGLLRLRAPQGGGHRLGRRGGTASTWPVPTPIPTPSPTPRCWRSSAIRWRSTPIGSWPGWPASRNGRSGSSTSPSGSAGGSRQPAPPPRRRSAGVLAAVGLGVAGLPVGPAPPEAPTGLRPPGLRPAPPGQTVTRRASSWRRGRRVPAR